MTDLTASEFSKRFVALVLGARELPRKPRALNVLLLSAVLGLEPGRSYSEREVNAELQKWILSFGLGFGLDYVTLRRLLIDARVLRRDPAGSSYQVEPDRGFPHDPAIHEIDLRALIEDARQDRERRKNEHMGGA